MHYVWWSRIFFLVYLLTSLCSVMLFLLRRHLEPIASRGWKLCVTQILMGLVMQGLLALQDKDKTCFGMLSESILVIPTTCTPYILRAYSSLFSYHTQKALVENRAHTDPLIQFLLKYKFTSSQTFQVTVYLLNILFYLLVTLLLFFEDQWFVTDETVRKDFSTYVFNRCYTHHLLPTFFTLFFTQATPMFVIMVLLFKARDTFYVRLELASVLAYGGSIFLIWIASVYVDFLPPPLTAPFLVFLVLMGFVVISLLFPLFGTYIFERRMREIEVGSEEGRDSKDLDPFLEVFEDPVLYAAFEKFAQESWCVENLVFHEKVKRFRTLEHDSQVEEAKLMWDLFLKQGAHYELNVPEGMREGVMEALTQGKVSLDLFSDVHNHVFDTLRKSTFLLFRSCGCYQDALERARNTPLKKV